MKIGRKIFGLKLTPKLLIAGTTLLIIPWLGIQTLGAMQQFLIDGQAQAQLLSARGIATLLHGRSDLFDDPTDDVASYADIPLYPLSGRILLDGYDEDWQNLSDHKLTFGSPDNTQFSLVLGQVDDTVYGLIKVTDSTPVYRHPGYLRLDHSDHVRLYLKNTNLKGAGLNDNTLKDTDSTEQRYLMTFEGSGRIAAYKMDEAWEMAVPGTPDYRIQGDVRITSNGYTLEFSFPISFLGNSHQFGMAIADVVDPRDRVIDTLISSFPSIEQGHYNRLIVRSPETERILQNLTQADSQIWILDNQLRVRATAGKLRKDGGTPILNPTDSNLQNKPLSSLLLDWLTGTNNSRLDDFNPAQTHAREGEFLQVALQGHSSVTRRKSLDGNHVIVSAVQAIFHSDEQTVIGLVLLEQTTNAILNLQSQSIQRIALLSLLGLITITLVVLVFSSRLTFRIKRLGIDTQKASDEQGRMQTKTDFRGLNAADEIGDLTRHIEQLLARLDRYQQFLVAIPRTLRHEINNPLNTVTTSLEHLENQVSEQRYLNSAQRGLQRIAAITESLAEAASLEEALVVDHMLKINLNDLLSIYVENQRRQNKHAIELQLPNQEVWILGSDIHIEQLLDKLLDNAIDYSPRDRAIEINLSITKSHCQLSITNHGSPIPEAQLPELFQLFHSRRDGEQSNDQNGQHLGLGLYIARVICERHGGDLAARNLDAGDGVVFVASLPLSG